MPFHLLQILFLFYGILVEILNFDILNIDELYQETLLLWSGSKQTYYDYLQDAWKKVYEKTQTNKSFQSFWDRLLHDGVFELNNESKEIKSQKLSNLSKAYISLITLVIFIIV